MASGRNIVYDYLGEFWNQTQASQWMHFFDDGLFVGQFGTSGDNRNPTGRPLPGFAGFDGWTSMIAVDSANHTPTAGAPSELYVWANDQNNYFGAIRWHILGASLIRELSATGALNSQIAFPTASPVPYPTALTVVPGDGQVTLSWNAAMGASTYNVKFSDRRGGPYTTLMAATPGTSYTALNVPNGLHRFYVVAASNNDATNSNEVAAVAFTTVSGVGFSTGGPSVPLAVTSTGVLRNQPALAGLSQTLGNLLLTSLGTHGYAIFDWGGVDASGNGADSVNLAPGFTVTKGANWQQRGSFMANRFTVDGKRGQDAAMYVAPASMATIAITPSDAGVHYLTVFCPSATDNAPHTFTVSLSPVGQSSPAATYTVDDAAVEGDNHIFQFEFKGNVTLTVNSLAKNPGTDANTVLGSLQAIFLD